MKLQKIKFFKYVNLKRKISNLLKNKILEGNFYLFP